MSTEMRDLIRLFEELSPANRAEVADFARFLWLGEQDERWEKLIDSTAPRPNMEAFLRASAAEGRVPLDVSKL